MIRYCKIDEGMLIKNDYNANRDQKKRLSMIVIGMLSSNVLTEPVEVMTKSMQTGREMPKIKDRFDRLRDLTLPLNFFARAGKEILMIIQETFTRFLWNPKCILSLSKFKSN